LGGQKRVFPHLNYWGRVPGLPPTVYAYVLERKSEFIGSSLASCFQILINAVACLTSPPVVTLRMPVTSEPYVETTCAASLPGFVTSLAYNVLLVSVCSYYAFRTRGLPDNFNESRYIALCVYATLVIWVAFVPSYFTTFGAFQQVIILSSALVFNPTVVLLCLYAPKVYAVVCPAYASSTGNESADVKKCGSKFKYERTTRCDAV